MSRKSVCALGEWCDADPGSSGTRSFWRSRLSGAPFASAHAAPRPGHINRSRHLGARELDHLAPFLGFVRDEIAEIRGRAGQHRRAEFDETCLQFGISKDRINLAV